MPSSPLNYHQLLHAFFGITELRQGQKEAIESILAGHNTLVLFPTGAGKSLCYQLPALCFNDELSLVISPLVALMDDQVNSLKKRHIPAACIHHATPTHTRQSIIDQIKKNELRLLYLSPETLSTPFWNHLLSTQKIALCALDEAHCFTLWGEQFRPSYLFIPNLIKGLNPRTFLALSATASPDIKKSLQKSFSISSAHCFESPAIRPNLTIQYIAVSQKEKQTRLLNYLLHNKPFPAVLYLPRREDCESMAFFLEKNGIEARSYHAGIPAPTRHNIEQSFRKHHFKVLCATIAFGMGVNIPHIRGVFHTHLPYSLESWLQEIGRAGRDGKPSHIALFLSEEDYALSLGFIQARSPSKSSLRAVFEKIFTGQKRLIFSRYDTSTSCDLFSQTLHVLLARLRIQGYIIEEKKLWKWAKIKPLCSGKRLFEGWREREISTLKKLLSFPQPINLLDFCHQDADSLLQILGMLRTWEESGSISLEFSHSLDLFSIPHKLTLQQRHLLIEKTLEQSERLCQAVFDVKRFLENTQTCLWQQVSSHFHSPQTPPCGHCPQCKSLHPIYQFKENIPLNLSLTLQQDIAHFAKNLPPSLKSPQRFARFLSGIYSPAMQRFNLYKNDLWACLSDVPYASVLAYTTLFF